MCGDDGGVSDARGGGDEAPRRGAGEEARTKTGGRGAGEKQRTKTGGEPRRADSPARKQRTKTGDAEPARSRELRRADSPARKKGVPDAQGRRQVEKGTRTLLKLLPNQAAQSSQSLKPLQRAPLGETVKKC